MGRIGWHRASAVQAQDGQALRKEPNAQPRQRGRSSGDSVDLHVSREPKTRHRRFWQARHLVQVQESREHVRSCGKWYIICFEII